jgi:hypothetical protein
MFSGYRLLSWTSGAQISYRRAGVGSSPPIATFFFFQFFFVLWMIEATLVSGSNSEFHGTYSNMSNIGSD